MARGVMAIAETQDEAERQVLGVATQVRILRSREIDMGGLPPLQGRQLPRHWVVVVEHPDPHEEAKLPQREDPETHCERETRLMYLKLAVDPMLLVTGSIERFACPACAASIEIKLPHPRETGDKPQNRQCPECRTPLTRPKPGRAWEVIPLISKPPQPCIFCGVVDDSHEHVIPEWISRRLGVKDFLSANDAFIHGNRTRRKQDISFASHRSQCFCHSCNTHFKHLEDAVIPLLVPMARGQVVSLGADSQALIALWADKTAMALIAADEKLQDTLPDDHRRAVRMERRVADDTWVGFFGWRGGPVLGTGQARVTDRTNPALVRWAYAAFLTFAKIGFFVMGFVEPLEPQERTEGERPPLCQFWPPRASLVHWPLPTAADNTILPTLMHFAPIRRD